MINERYFRLKKNGEPDYRCYCRHPELIENYNLAIADETQVWQVHHRKEEFYSYKELIERGEYYDISPEELIFLTIAEHRKIDSFCKRLSKAHIGKKPSNSKKVLCIETDEVFESTYDAERKTGIFHNSISNACNGKYKTSGGYHWKFV